MKFSILIANYNNGHFFKDCYHSIIDQTYRNWEVIIVDDCSTDNSLEVIEALVGEDPRFKIFVNEENKGCGYTKNKCAELANGDVLGFLDPDDLLYPSSVQIMIKKHREYPDASLITSTFEMVDENLCQLQYAPHGASIPENESYLTYGNGALTHFATFKKTSYESTAGINPILKRAVDQDLYYKMEEEGKHIFLDKVLYKYRVHSGSISNNNNLYKARYWHFITILNAYKRRGRLYPKIPNFTKTEICRFKSTYYFGRFERIKFSNKDCTKLYFLSKSIYARPFHLFELKIKSLILVLLKRI